MVRLFLPALTLLAAIWAARIVNPSELDIRFERMEGWLRRFGPLAAAGVTVILIWWVWGGGSPLPIVHDESSYVLQADIFARFRWTSPSPPIPEFFEQPHVLVVPALASKYPPGHALLLALGSVLRLPPLVPLLLSAATAALLMIVVMRLTNAWVALLTWIIWITTPLVLRFQPSYFSEVATTALALAAWWCLIEWRESRRLRWLLLLAVAVGWGGITRPLTMLAFAIPMAAVVLWDVSHVRSWKPWSHIVLAFLVTCAVLAILPLWSWRTTGDPKLTPVTLYTRDYLPFDKPGFTPDTTPPRRALSPVVKSLYDDFLAHHERQRLRDLPRTVSERLTQIARDLFRGTQVLLVPFFLIGLVSLNRELRIGLVSAFLLFAFYVPYAHDAPWTLYYLEVAPAIAAVSACGIWRVLVWVASGVVVQLHIARRPKLGSALVAIVLTFFALPTLSFWRLQHTQMSSTRRSFELAVSALPASKMVIFLRYANRPHHMSLVYNHADVQSAPVWVVHDLGPRNQELTKLVLDRAAWVFDEASLTFKRGN